jgi:hypothetical protein
MIVLIYYNNHVLVLRYSQNEMFSVSMVGFAAEKLVLSGVDIVPSWDA